MTSLALALAILVSVVLGTNESHAGVAPRPSPGCGATTVAHGRPLDRTIRVNGIERHYLLDVPESVRAGTPVALLLDFHGLGHSAAGVWRVSEFKDLAARDGFITVYPDGLPVRLLGRTGPGWEIVTLTSNRDVDFVRALLDELERTYCIDRARIFATGFSNGAFLSHVLACALSDRIAAIAPVSGGRVTVACTPTRGVPVLIIHGRQDTIVPAAQARQARDFWLRQNDCREHVSNGCEYHRECRDGAEVRYCESDFAHRWPPGATAQIWEFFRAHPMGQ